MGIIASLMRWATGADVKVDVLPDELGPEADIPDPDSTLTPREVAYIRASWSLVQPDLKTHGIKFFILLFETHPNMQSKFKPFKGKPLEELIYSKRLAAHGTTVMTAIDSYVNNLDDVSTVLEMLKTTGENHKARGITKRDFDDLLPVLIQYFREGLGPAFTEETEKAWNHLLKVVTSTITASF